MILNHSYQAVTRESKLACRKSSKSADQTLAVCLTHKRVNSVAEIVDIQLAGLRQRLGEHNIQLELDNASRIHLVGRGFDPSYVARPLKRATQEEIETPFAHRLISGEVKDRMLIRVGASSEGELQFNTGEV